MVVVVAGGVVVVVMIGRVVVVTGGVVVGWTMELESVTAAGSAPAHAVTIRPNARAIPKPIRTRTRRMATGSLAQSLSPSRGTHRPIQRRTSLSIHTGEIEIWENQWPYSRRLSPKPPRSGSGAATRSASAVAILIAGVYTIDS